MTLKKIFIINSVLALYFVPSILRAQFKIKSISISSNYIEIQTKTTYPNGGFSFDTNASAEGFNNDTLFNWQDTIITSGYHYSGDYQGYRYDDGESISIGIDTVNKVFTSIEASLVTTLYNYYPGKDYTFTRFINCVFLPYNESKLSLIANLTGADLNKIAYKGGGFFFSSKDSTDSFVKVLNFPDSAYVSIIIEKLQPRSSVITEKKDDKVIIDSRSKILKIISSMINYSFSCFDLLGRRHNLEFLGTDGAASTYSVRSLRSGVYFVSDGKEMVKFMVGE